MRKENVKVWRGEIRRVLSLTTLVAALIPTHLEAASEAASDDEGTPARFFAALSYRYAGPSRGGRVTTVAGHPDQPSTFYMGATGGGVWKTSDYGQSWHPISDGAFATGSIGAIGVATSDPNLLYVGTGSDGLRSNVIIGKGVYKSSDAGKTWQHLGLQRVGNIGALLIHPQDPDLVYVAAIGNPFAPNPERGVFRTRDGGQSWEHILFVSERTGAVDLEFAPDNPREIYAALWEAERRPWTIISGGYEGGLRKSSDGGETWAPLAEGLPTGLRGKADLAVSPADPDRVYVLIEAPGNEGGVYRSSDRGASWTQVSDFQPIRNRPFYYTNLEAHPRNADVLWGMAEGHWKSEDGGKTWSRQSTPHGDNHDLWINPRDPQIMIQSNDGGANVTLNGGQSWSTQHNQPTAELYQVDVSDDFPYRLYAGQQDNTTISVPSLPARFEPGGHTSYWEAHGGCETGPAVPKPGDPEIVYANCKGRFGVYNRRTGQEQQYYVGFWDLYGHNPKDLEFRFQRVAPIHVSPHDPNRVYHASQFLHVTEDNGLSWQKISPDLTAFTPETQVVSGSPITIDVTGEEHFSTIYEIQESPHEAGVIWVGANDGPVHVTRDGGRNWTDVTPPDLGPYGRVQTIEVSPHDAAKAYLCVLRYQMGDFRPHLFRTHDYGKTWTRLTDGSNGIPADFPVRVVREDPDRAGLLFAGTEFGMFVSFDDGSSWHSLQLNLPVTPVTDLKVVEKDLVLSTMGRGFWILDNLTPLHEMSPRLELSPAHLFGVRRAYRSYLQRRWRNRDPAAPEYLEPGVQLDYYLADVPSSPLRLEILDSGGELIRSFASDVTAEGSGEEGSPMDRFRPGGGARQGLPARQGMHRFTWDLRYPGAWNPASKQPSGLGPMVPPGTYQARLSAGEWSASQAFRVELDPRVQREGISSQDLLAQARLALQVRDALSRARQLAARIEEVLKEGEQAEQEEGGGARVLDEARKSALESLQAELVTAPVRYSQPMLIDQLDYLYDNLISADQRPGADADRRYRVLSDQLEEIASAWGERDD